MENCPIISVNVKVWKFWSWILVHNYMRYISIVPVTILNFLQFTDLYRAWGNIGEVIINAYFAVLYLNAVVRALVLISNRHKYEKFLNNIAEVYREISAESDENTQTVLREFTKRGRLFSFFNLGLGLCISLCFVIYPLFTNTRALPYGMYIPGIDNFRTPLYEILYVLQILLTFPGCCMYIPYTIFFTTSTLFGLIQIKALKYQIVRLMESNEGNKTIDRKLNSLIIIHQRIIGYVGEINSLVTFICLLEFLSFGLMLCALLFLLNIITRTAHLIIVCSYIFMILTQIFTFYWHANEVREESMTIAMAIYSGSWLDFTIPMKKKLILIMIRAARPLEIQVGNVYPMTLEMFQSLLNASYSYFTLLRHVYK